MFWLLGGVSLVIFLFGFNPFFTPEKEVAGLSVIEISNTPSPTPTFTLTPTPTPKPSASPTKTKEDSSTDILVYPYKTTVDLLQQVNSFRVGKGLSPLTANPETCFFAKTRVHEISSNFSHDGFYQRIDSKTLPYPSWSEVAENIAVNPDPTQVVPGWINSPGHNENLSKNVPFGCVVNTGHYYVFEAWAP